MGTSCADDEPHESLPETAYLSHSPENARHLIAAIARLESGAGTPHELIERAEEPDGSTTRPP